MTHHEGLEGHCKDFGFYSEVCGERVGAVCSGSDMFFFGGVVFFFLWSHPWHMDVPRRGVKLELQLPAYTTATTTQDLSQV